MIGHTKSGKPIYMMSHEPYAKATGGKMAPSTFKDTMMAHVHSHEGFTSADHEDAAKALKKHHDAHCYSVDLNTFMGAQSAKIQAQGHKIASTGGTAHLAGETKTKKPRKKRATPEERAAKEAAANTGTSESTKKLFGKSLPNVRRIA